MSEPTDPQNPQNGSWNGQPQEGQSGVSGQPQYPTYGQPGDYSYNPRGQYNQGGQPQSQPTPSVPQYGQAGQTGYGQTGYGQTGYGQPGYTQPGSTPQYGQPGQASFGQSGQYGQNAQYGQPGQGTQYPQPGGSAPYGGSSPASPKPGGGINKKLLAIIAGALALLLVILFVVLGISHRGKKDNNNTSPTANGSTSAGASGSSSNGPAADVSTPDGAVKAYFQALANGDSKTALSFAQTSPTDDTFLNDTVLKQAMKNSPITNITTSASNSLSDYARVAYSYKLGQRQINDEMSATKVGDAWKLEDVAADVSFYRQNAKLPMMLNGTKVNAQKIYLFPGTYDVTTGNQYITYGSGKLNVDSPNAYPSTSDLDPTLSAAGKTAYIAAAKAKLADCLKQKSLAPAGCGFSKSAPSGVKIVPNSITWSLGTGGTSLDTLKGRLDYDDPMTVKDYIYIPVKVTAKGTDGATYTGTSSASDPVGTITDKGITVVFGD